MSQTRQWVREAIRKIDADFNRSADTHLIRLEIPSIPQVHLYLKDESTHPTGSLKHRLGPRCIARVRRVQWSRLSVIRASGISTRIIMTCGCSKTGMRFSRIWITWSSFTPRASGEREYGVLSETSRKMKDRGK